MSTISINQPPHRLATGNPWGAVAPRAHLGNEEYKLVPDSVQINSQQTSAPAAAKQTAAAGKLSTPSLQALGQQTAQAVASAAHANPMMLVLLGSHDSSKLNQAQKLAENLGLVHLHMGDLIKEEVASGSDLGKAISCSLEDGNASPAVLLYELVADRVKQDDCREHGFILDAYPEDFKDHKAEDLLKELSGLRLIQLEGSTQNCPDCIPLLDAAREKGAYFEIDDEEDEQDTADVLEALVDNFQSAPVQFLKIEE